MEWSEGGGITSKASYAAALAERNAKRGRGARGGAEGGVERREADTRPAQFAELSGAICAGRAAAVAALPSVRGVERGRRRNEQSECSAAALAERNALRGRSVAGGGATSARASVVPPHATDLRA